VGESQGKRRGWERTSLTSGLRALGVNALGESETDFLRAGVPWVAEAVAATGLSTTTKVKRNGEEDEGKIRILARGKTPLPMLIGLSWAFSSIDCCLCWATVSGGALGPLGRLGMVVARARFCCSASSESAI